MLLSNWNWSTLEVIGEEGRVEVEGEKGRRGEEEGRKVGGGDRGRGTERREKRGVGRCFHPIETRTCGRCVYMYVEGEEKRGYKIGGGKKKGTLRVLDDVFIQLKLYHAGGTYILPHTCTCTCMWKDIVY